MPTLMKGRKFTLGTVGHVGRQGAANARVDSTPQQRGFQVDSSKVGTEQRQLWPAANGPAEIS